MFFEKLHEFFWENYNSSDYVYVGRKCLHRGEKILIKENNYECIKKYSPNEKKEIVKAFEKLRQMIEVEENYGVPFEKIFNNETLKYDILGSGFYTYKAHGKDKAQIRILYRFVRMPERRFELEMHMVSIKRRSDKDYIKKFERYVESYMR